MFVFTMRYPFYQIEGAGGTGTPNVEIEEEPKDTNGDDDNGDQDEESEEESEDEEEDDSDKEEDEDKEDDIELSRVSLTDIKGKYPNFFKDFPDLKHAFFREQQFTEVFPTIEDARKAAEAQVAYEEMTDAVTEGNAQHFLSELRNENPEALEKFANNFLPALQETSKDLYFATIGPTVRHFVRQVFVHGENEKDDNVKNAAKIVHKLIFGGGYDDVERGGNELNITRTNNKDSSVEEDKKKYFAGKYQSLYTDVGNSCHTELEKQINKGLSDLDKGQKGLARLITNEVKNKVLAEMDKDSAYLSRMQNLWKREQRMGFQGQLKNSFLTVFMSKAKTLIPKIRAEVRKEALGKSANGSKNDGTRITAGKQSSGNKGKITPEKAREQKLSTRAIFDA